MPVICDTTSNISMLATAHLSEIGVFGVVSQIRINARSYLFLYILNNINLLQVVVNVLVLVLLEHFIKILNLFFLMTHSVL